MGNESISSLWWIKWLNQKEIDKFDVNSIECNCIDGYVLQVDLEYPDEMHEMHNDYPLAPEKLKINHDMLSNYCSNIANYYEIKIGSVNKLAPNLGNKSKYVLHYKNLQLYLSLGMKLIKVHRTLKFRQLDWLKTYIDFNTDKRKNAANSFENYFFKLKTMENLRKRINVRLIISAEDYKKYESKVIFVSQKIFSENFVAIHETKLVLTLNKPIYVGFSILDLSKLLMYDFHYNYIKRTYDAKLLFRDTDSLVYEIKTNDVYEDFYKDKNLFDFSDYPQDSTFLDPVNKKVIDKMKDDFKVKIISGFVGLKSKIYSLIDVDNEENKKSKRTEQKT